MSRLKVHGLKKEVKVLRARPGASSLGSTGRGLLLLFRF